MCMLCVVQKWSRRVIKVLPWLVIPLTGLWALSQLLPPRLQFEITSPRLACVVVLLGTVFWYEVVLPQLTVHRAQRSARVRERQRMQAVELQKLRKTATRRCRNCLATYREQNPGGGKFMCSYCGHVSKRPMVDLPGPPGKSGFISNLFGNNSWFCSQDYSAEGSENCVSPFPRYWVTSSEEQFLTEKSCSGAAVFTRKPHLSFFSCAKWFYRRVLRLSSYGEDGFSDTDHKRLSRKGENGVNCQEGKGEKARRKAEEKRQARLEKEMLEEEERKQREEVARLIEERRKLRDENLEAEKERLKGLASDGERDRKKASEKRRQDRRKEKDKSSSKSNSDGEGHEKRGIRETEKKHEFQRKGEAEKWDPCNPRIESQKTNVAVVNSVKGEANKSKYFDRTRGAFSSSSRGLNGTAFLGKGSHSSTVSVTESSRPIGGFVDHMQRRECHAVEHVIGKSLSNGDAKALGTTCPQHTQASTLKRSWHQLFTCPSAGLPCSDANALERLNQISQPEVQISQLLDQKVPSQPLDNQMQFGKSLAFTAYPLMSSSPTGNSASTVAESRFSLAGEPGHSFTIEEAETFEDPCYVPDPISLIGPVSESLDNFVNAGSGFPANFRSDHFHILKNKSDSADANKPSPIESPMSKLWLSEERHIASGPCSPKSQDQGDSPGGESNDVNEQGTWQMWNSPLCQDLLGLVGAPASCLLGPRQDKNTHEEIIHLPAHNPMASHAVKENSILQGSFNHSHNVHFGICQNDDMMSSVTPIVTENDPWLQGTILHPFPGDGGNQFAPLNFNGSASQNVVVCESPKGLAANRTFDQLPAHYWSKDWAAHGGEDIGISNITRSHIGASFPSNPDVQSVWSFNSMQR